MIVFLVGICLMGLFTYHTNSQIQNNQRTLALMNAKTYGQRIEDDLEAGVQITNSLEQILINSDGQVHDFSKIAKYVMSSSIQSVQLAPNGVVTEIYPENGNEAGKIDLLNDSNRSEISNYAKKYHTTIIQGPFDLKQGGSGIAIRNPVYLEDESGQEYFWGFTIVIVRVPKVFEDSTNALSKFRYTYRLSKQESPWNKKYKEVYASTGKMIQPESYDFIVGQEKWKLEVMPKDGWNHTKEVSLVLVCGMIIVLLLTILTKVLLLLDERRIELKELAHKDGLTKLYNRYGFDELADKMLSKNPQAHYIAAMLDVDDFKIVNDMYGHEAGDTALRILAQSMRNAFEKDAILCRNGGDEFSAVLIGMTEAEAKEKIEKFTMQPRYITQNGEKRPFYISLGYAEYPKDCDDVSELIRCADMALYAVKLHGKHSCCAYEGNYKVQHRSQLGFALQDVSRNLPGAFLIYIADKMDDRILFANQELIRFAGCKDYDEFLAYTDQRFRNLIHPEEQDAVETSIWKQIDSAKSENNDYVKFRFAKKDGTYRPVFDHGRIVKNRYYGNVFYVLIMDCALIDSYYDKT